MDVYEIRYDYCNEDGYCEEDITEEFEGNWDELKDYIKQMKRNGCYNIDATFLYDTEDTYESYRSTRKLRIAETYNKGNRYEDNEQIREAFSENDDLEDLIQEFEQEYDSSVTSINSAKLPTIFGLVQKLGGFKQGSMNLDYGGGRFDNVAQYLKDYDVLNLVYDPFNRSKEHNKDVIDFVKKNGGADTVTCSNVLNVIKEPENRLSVIKNCDRLVKSGGTVYFTVYEGSGSGEGKANDKRKSYQTNMKTEDYQKELEQVFGSVTRKGKLFICK